jgi:hypothetical protein
MENTAKNQNAVQNAINSTNAGHGNGFNMDNLTNMFNNIHIPDTLKQYGDKAVKTVNNMSTTQKVIGGALLVLGAGYLSRRSLNLGGLANLASRMKR